MFGHPSHPKLSTSSLVCRPNWESEPNHWRHAPRLCYEQWPKMGQTPSTGRVLLQQQLPREHQDLTFWSTLWTTLSHTTELVWVGWKGYLWSWHCDRGRRESKANPCKYLDRPISSEELHWQEVPPLGIWSGSPSIPLSLPNERCMSLWHQREASSSLHWPISYHWLVWVVILSSGATIEAIGSSQRVSRIPTQKMSEAPDWCCGSRYHPIGARLDVQGISHQDSRPIRPSHPKQDYSVLQGSMEWPLWRWNHMGTSRLLAIQLPWVSSDEVTNSNLVAFCFLYISRWDSLLRGVGCNTPSYKNHNQGT
jgi:hypothetical protein